MVLPSVMVCNTERLAISPEKRAGENLFPCDTQPLNSPSARTTTAQEAHPDPHANSQQPARSRPPCPRHTRPSLPTALAQFQKTLDQLRSQRLIHLNQSRHNEHVLFHMQ